MAWSSLSSLEIRRKQMLKNLYSLYCHVEQLLLSMEILYHLDGYYVMA